MRLFSRLGDDWASLFRLNAPRALVSESWRGCHIRAWHLRLTWIDFPLFDGDSDG
jgi:hypothetical protein